MPVAGHDSSTARSFGPAAYVPTDDAWTILGTAAAAAVSNTRRLPSTLVARVTDSSREGWINQARCTTASAPRNVGLRSAFAMSAWTQRVFGSVSFGARRLMPTISSTAGSATSARSRAVPTFPLAPVTTTRMDPLCPTMKLVNRPEDQPNHVLGLLHRS